MIIFIIWNISYITLTLIPPRLLRTHKLPAPNVSGFRAQLVRASHQCRGVTASNPVKPNVSGFKAQLVRVSHRYRKVRGSNPFEVLTFSGFYICNSIKCIYNWEDHCLLDDLFYISFHHSNWLILDLLSQQILTVLSPFCCHSSASPTWPVGFLYDPMFF